MSDSHVTHDIVSLFHKLRCHSQLDPSYDVLFQQRRAERDRMANRPFATIHLLLPSDMEPIGKVECKYVFVLNCPIA